MQRVHRVLPHLVIIDGVIIGHHDPQKRRIPRLDRNASLDRPLGLRLHLRAVKRNPGLSSRDDPVSDADLRVRQPHRDCVFLRFSQTELITFEWEPILPGGRLGLQNR